MINKHSIYNWLFFPLLAFMLAGSATSCSNDPAMEEDTSGKSTLSIKVRGITTTAPGTNGSYDDYVKTLRVIGYDNTGTVVCNQKYSSTELGTVEGTDPNTYIEITQTLEDAFQGGVCDFYFIANEDGYSVYNSQTTPKPTLSAFLGDKAENAPSKENLNSCIIAFDAQKGLTPGYPILMTIHSTSQFLKPGTNDMGRISLVRCLARVQLKITKDVSFTEDVSVDNVQLTGSCPDSYSLWNTGTYIAYNAIEITRNLENMSSVGDGMVFTSSALMFPEKLGKGGNTVIDTDLKYTFSLTSGNTTKNYKIGIGKGKDTDQSVIEDYNIYRNHWYRTNVNFLGWQSQIKITYEVDDWKDGEDYVLEFAYPSYTNPIQPMDGITFNQPSVYYNSDADSDDGTFQCQFTITRPVGQEWQPTLFNTTPGDYEITVYKGTEKQDPPYRISDDPYTLKIRALKPENVNHTVELGISYTPQWDPSATSLLLINGTEGDPKWLGSDDPEKIVIKQVEIPSVP